MAIQGISTPNPADQPVDNTIGLPMPPMCACQPANTVYRGENIILDRINGEKMTGTLDGFNSTNGFINILSNAQAEATKLSMHEIRCMHLPKNRQWVQDENLVLSQKDGMQLPSAQLEFEIEFTDHTRIDGKTFGFRNDRYGIHLFPTIDNRQYTHLFIPNSAITNHRIGKQLGQQLVNDRIASYQDVAMVLLEQQENRARNLGEQLKINAVVTEAQLELAVRLQAKKPHMQLGEILIEEKLITKEQLDAALEQQKRSRSIPLGALLVSNGVVTSAGLQQSLAAKLGVPFVDLHKFPLRAAVLNLVPAEFAKAHRTIPLHHYDKKLVVALENPTNWEIVNKLQDKTQLLIEPVMATPDDISWAIAKHYKTSDVSVAPRRKLKSVGEKSVETRQQKAPVTALDENKFFNGLELNDDELEDYVRKLLVSTTEQGVTNIHIESLADGSANIHFRKDGELLDKGCMPEGQSSRLINHIRRLARLGASDAGPQMGVISNLSPNHPHIKVNVAALPTAGGSADLVLKLSQPTKPGQLEQLGFSDNNLKCLTELINRPRGLILVCGPMGSGKTTTLLSMLSHLDPKRKKIWILDPSGGIAPPGAREIYVASNTGQTMAATLDVALNADPDVVMIGDLSDHQVAQKAIGAALAGRLIFSSLYVDLPSKVIDRLINMAFPPYEVADALIGVLTQRLAKKLCQHCKKRYAPSQDELRMLAAEYNTEMTMLDSNLKQNKLLIEKIMTGWKEKYSTSDGELMLFQATGCGHCGHTGYSGRIAIHELLKVTENLRRTIVENPGLVSILKAAIGEGMMTLRQDGIEKIFQGQTDIIQVRATCSR